MLKLSVIVPAFNEERTIAEILRRVKAVPLEPLGVDAEIIVVDDGSVDGTAVRAGSVPGVTVIEAPRNRGKGAAVRLGLERAKGDYVIIQDADLEYDPEDYPRLLRPLLDGTATVVYGSRVLGLDPPGGRGLLRKHRDAYWLAYVGARIVTGLTNLLFSTRLTDEPTCYKCFAADVIRSISIESDGFAWEPEVTAKIARRGIPIVEVPISYDPRSFEDGKKVGWKDGIQAVWTLVKYRIAR
jgi:glycosyltransferase involved in cell wall biosynthesis